MIFRIRSRVDDPYQNIVVHRLEETENEDDDAFSSVPLPLKGMKIPPISLVFFLEQTTRCQ